MFTKAAASWLDQGNAFRLSLFLILTTDEKSFIDHSAVTEIFHITANTEDFVDAISCQ